MLGGAALCLALWPAAASAQTSGIAGTIKDASGAVLPGVTVEAASPALIEKTRTAVTDGSGKYNLTELRPGTYTVTYTLPGFSTVKRENVELTSDFTATINIELKVGAVEETITVAAESPIVDTQSITTRTVMTRDVLDAIPSGRNIQAVGIMIPGTTIALGGGGALSRDVGGSGNLQQSPLQFRGSADTVQTVEGMRLNNLCAQGAYSGVYWNEGSFQEFSYVTGADSAEMGQGGIRVNMVPKDGGNTFHGALFGNYTPSKTAADNCASPGLGLACTRSELTGDTTFNPKNSLTNVSALTKNYDSNIGVGGPIAKDKAWFYGSFRYLGVNKTVTDTFYNANTQIPGRFVPYVADLTRPGIDDGHIRSFAGRVTAQLTEKDKISYYHDEQDKVRGHWGISSLIQPEAAAIQATPTSFVSVSKWTRTQSNKLLFDGGFAVYDQEYQENYQPDVTAVTPPLYTIVDSATSKTNNAWPSPADHFSKLFTESFSASYVTGSHSMKVGTTLTQGRWRLVTQYTNDIEPVTFNAGNPSSVTLRMPTDRRNAIKMDAGVFAQDRWTIQRATINAGIRYDQFIGSTLPESLVASRWNSAVSYGDCPGGVNDLNGTSNGGVPCTGRVQNWKDISPRLGLAYDLFGNGRTAVKVSVARYVNGQAIATADANNPEATATTSDQRAWKDLDGNGSPLDSAGNVQLNELTNSTSTPSFGKNTPSSTVTDPAVLNGWGVRGYNWEFATSVQHELMPKWSAGVAYYRRSYGNQTFTQDLRFTQASYDGPFCISAPSDPNLPFGGGNYQVCGLNDLKPAIAANPGASRSLIHFAKDVGSGFSDVYQGVEVQTVARFSRGSFFQAGVSMNKRVLDQCNLINDPTVIATTPSFLTQSVVYPDGERACHAVFPYRPDTKLLGSYTLPYDVLISGTYQYTIGIQDGTTGGGSLAANWAVPNANFASALAPFRTPAVLSAGATTKTVGLIPSGLNFGPYNLSQLDMRLSKRFRVDKYRFRVDADFYNVFNSDWPYTLNTTFSTAASANWMRPTNVLQARFFKIGAQFDF
jgi:hypothetical protein